MTFQFFLKKGREPKMVDKPSSETILTTYSFDELLNLVKMKAEKLVDEQLAGVKKYLESLSVEEKETPTITEKPVRKKAGRPVGKTQSEKKMTLGAHLLEVLGSEPKKVDEIMDAILDRGYQTKSDNPKKILQLELGKQIKRKTIKKVGYGVYVRK